MIRKRGFTLVELNLAMAFVAILLLMVAATAIHVSRLYERGVTIRTVNQAGREVMSQMRTDIAAAQAQNTAFIELGETGRLCLGEVSYLYNKAQGIDGAKVDLFTIEGETRIIGLVRVLDPGARWCQLDEAGAPNLGTDISPDLFGSRQAAEMLIRDDYVPLAVHGLEFEATQASQPLYQLSLLLGTNQGGSVEDGFCRPPSDNQANFEQCFVADFSTIIRAGVISS